MNDKTLKSFNGSKKIPITFKNSEFINLSGSDSGKIIGGNEKIFIKTMNNFHPGISCYNIEDQTIVSIGSVSDIQQESNNSLNMIGGMGGFIGSLLVYIANNSISKSTYNSLNPYSQRSVSYFNCLLDDENNHLQKDVDSFVFNSVLNFNNRYKNFE